MRFYSFSYPIMSCSRTLKRVFFTCRVATHGYFQLLFFKERKILFNNLQRNYFALLSTLTSLIFVHSQIFSLPLRINFCAFTNQSFLLFRRQSVTSLLDRKRVACVNLVGDELGFQVSLGQFFRNKVDNECEMENEVRVDKSAKSLIKLPSDNTKQNI